MKFVKTLKVLLLSAAVMAASVGGIIAGCAIGRLLFFVCGWHPWIVGVLLTLAIWLTLAGIIWLLWNPDIGLEQFKNES